MASKRDVAIRDIEVVEDFTSSARCDEGFLQVRRLRCRNRRSDGSASPVYRVDVVDRPRLDAVAVVVYRREGERIELMTRRNLRPAAFFRKDKAKTVADPSSQLTVEEIIAGLLEEIDQGEEGIRSRAAAEVKEEGGFEVLPENVRILGGPFFLAPGILSEKVHLCTVDVTGLVQGIPEGDGSPLEEGASVRWRPLDEVLDACRRGEIQDAKTEIGAARLQLELKRGQATFPPEK
ncbi:MAG: NUDIX hydrolase [Myxococcaceae bacterium]